MQTESMTIGLKFTEPLLGSRPGNPEVTRDFIASRVTEDAGGHTDAEQKAKADEEVKVSEAQVEEGIQNASTVFAKDDNGLFVYDYTMRGFIKGALSAFIDLGEAPKELNPWNYKGVVDRFVFVFPRRIYLKTPTGENWRKAEQTLERSLRATTMRGDRVALARSEMLPEGTNCQFEVRILIATPRTKTMKKTGEVVPVKSSAVITLDLIRSCFDYAQLNGFGQWRSGGYGRATWEEIKSGAVAK